MVMVTMTTVGGELRQSRRELFLTVALQERGCHDDGGHDRGGTGVQRDARSGGFGGVATGVYRRRRSGIIVGDGGSFRSCGDCGVLGDHLLGGGRRLNTFCNKTYSTSV